MDIKYTKTELRQQQIRLSQLKKYLPTLQLKKAMLQLEINGVQAQISQLGVQLDNYSDRVQGFQQLYTSPDADNLLASCRVHEVKKHFENIAGVEIPIFEEVVFEKSTYALFDTSFWLESGIQCTKNLIETREKITILKEKKALLEKELREVSIRVNLFEKIMIPRTQVNIKKIKIFLGDQQLAAVSQAKASKRKILERKKKR
ncbi:MAG: V-type ATP synthase subunit D [Simkaniaceae bacterium]|nr:V-type ATP synthase subunit D [Candidatus Sacchlamyda saccharinae]